MGGAVPGSGGIRWRRLSAQAGPRQPRCPPAPEHQSGGGTLHLRHLVVLFNLYLLRWGHGPDSIGVVNGVS
jgi:hypothetical protein